MGKMCVQVHKLSVSLLMLCARGVDSMKHVSSNVNSILVRFSSGGLPCW